MKTEGRLNRLYRNVSGRKRIEKRLSLLCLGGWGRPSKRQFPFWQVLCAEWIVVFKIASTLVNKIGQGTTHWPQGVATVVSLLFTLFSSPTLTRWPIQTVHWEWSLLIAESVQALCEGELVAWNKAVPRTALTVELWMRLCQCLGPCPGPLWLPSAVAHMPLTLGRILLFLQPFLEFLAWIFVLFVCLRAALPGSELPSGAGQITRSITGC